MNRRPATLLICLALGIQVILPAVALAQPSLPFVFPMTAPIMPAEHNIMFRPIQRKDGRLQLADRSYPYGGTQGNKRAVHLGVEFVTPRGTAIVASLAGKVIFAGADDKTKLGPKLDYYGNAVIIAHDIESLAGEQIFTLYGHLDSIAVEAGQALNHQGLIGYVGSSGVAIGAHLHFEIRADNPFDHLATRNPALWLRHRAGSGLVMGAVRDAAGEFIYGKRLVLRNHQRTREVFTYASQLVNPDSAWGENFTVSDLPAGEYELVALSDTGGIAFREIVMVAAQRATFVTIELD